MRLVRPVVLLSLAVAASSPVQAQQPVHDCFGTPRSYSDARQAHATIDAAVAALPSSDLHGTFNRLDAIWHRAQVSDLACGDGDAGLLPTNVARGLEATLLDLADDLEADTVAGLGDAHFVTLLQVTRNYAFMRTTALYQANESRDCGVINPCPPGEGPCPPCIEDDPAAFEALDAVLDEVRLRFRDAWVANVGTPAPSLNVNNFADLVGQLSLVTGVESIDY